MTAIPKTNDIAIVCVGYNRIKSMSRLLNSLLAAKYPEYDIPLVISIDCSGDEELYNYVHTFDWPFGPKYVKIQKKRLGLKNHIFACGDLTDYFKAIVLLEDDIYVSPYFFHYVEETVEKYGSDDRIAQISLYTNETNGYVGLPLDFVKDGNDTFLMQDVSTWGECWTKEMWQSFKSWMKDHDEEYIKKIDMPIAIKRWTKAWSKYYNAYVVDTCKYVVYPYISLTTNFSDAGVHGGDNNSLVQVNLLNGPKDYNLMPYEEMSKYDIYYNNIGLYQWLNLSPAEVTLDIYGFHSENNGRPYILSTKKLPLQVVKSFALNMRPIELNVQYGISGNGIYLYEYRNQKFKYKRSYPLEVIEYYLKGFSHTQLIQATIAYYWIRIKSRITKWAK